MINLKPVIFTFFACVIFAVNCRADNFLVTSNADSGPGTLRQALTDAAANGNLVTDNISFALPTGQTTINVLTQLPFITSSVIIDGTTQPGATIAANGAKITLVGPGAGNQLDCFTVQRADDFEVYGMVIKEFCFILSNGYATGNSAISITGTCNKIIIGAPGKGNVMYDNGTGITNAPVVIDASNPPNVSYCEIKNNYIGVLEDGASFDNVTGNSIVLSYTHQILVGGNTAAEGNAMFGNFTISPYFDGTSSVITNNIFGASQSFQTPSSFNSTNTQVYFNSNITNASLPTSFLVTNNTFAALLSVNGFFDINLTLQTNTWGQSPTGIPLNIQGPAISLSALTGTTLIGGPDVSLGNKITNTINSATEITNGDAVIEVTQATTVELSHNSIFCNAKLKPNLPFEYLNTTAATKPMFITLNAVTGSSITGTTKPNARVEVFYTDKECTGCEPEKYIASVNADASGNWAYNGAVDPAFNVVASATLNKISSEFSDPEVDVTGKMEVDVKCTTLGSITGITATNGNQAQWFNAATSNPVGPPGYDLTNAQAGQYYLVVNQFGCYYITPTYTIGDQRPKLNTDGLTTSNSTCGLPNGSITGLKPSNYVSLEWMDASGNNVGSNSDLTNVPAGSYTLRLYGPDCYLDFGPFTIGSGNDVITISAASATINPDECGLGQGSIKNVTVSGGSGTLKYSWTDANSKVVSTATDATGLLAGTYTLTVTDASCGLATQTFTIINNSETVTQPQANNVKVCGDAADLKVTNVQSGYTYNLYSDNTATAPLQTNTNGNFTVITTAAITSYYISAALGSCESARTQVTVTQGNDFGTIPSAFTPNGDGINDYWEIDGLAAYPGALVQVFNRYGQQVYQSKGYSIPWDGTFKGAKLPVGTYYYIITLTSSKCSLLSGYVAILR